MKKKNLLILVTVLFVFQYNIAQELPRLVEWNFTLNPTLTDVTGKEETFDAVLYDMDLEKPVLSRGAGITNDAGYTRGFVGTTIACTTKADAVTANNYFEFTVKPKDGSVFNMSELFAQLRKRKQTDCIYQWSYSKNGNSFVDIASPVTLPKDDNESGIDQNPIDLSGIADLQGLTSGDEVVFRIYVWGDSQAGFGFGKSQTTSSTTYKASLYIKGTATRNISVVASWNFKNLVDIDAQGANINPTDADLNIDATTTQLSRGAGFEVGSLAYGYASKAPLFAQSKADAVTNNEYYQIDLKSNVNYSIKLNKLTYKYRRNASGTINGRWSYSLNGTTFTEIGNEDIAFVHSGIGEIYTQDLSTIGELQNINPSTTLTLRLYVWGAQAATQVFGLGRYVAGAALVPEPNTNSVVIRGDVTPYTATNMEKKEDNKLLVNYDRVTNSLLIQDYHQLNEKGDLSVLDISGRKIYVQTISNTTGDIHITLPHYLPNGTYVVLLRLAREQQVAKFIR